MSSLDFSYIVITHWEKELENGNIKMPAKFSEEIFCIMCLDLNKTFDFQQYFSEANDI